MALLTTQRTVCDRCGKFAETVTHGPTATPLEIEGWIHIRTTVSHANVISLLNTKAFMPQDYDFCSRCWPLVRIVPRTSGTLIWSKS